MHSLPTIYRFGLLAVFDIRVGRFGCCCGPFWTGLWAIFALLAGRFGLWAVLDVAVQLTRNRKRKKTKQTNKQT